MSFRKLNDLPQGYALGCLADFHARPDWRDRVTQTGEATDFLIPIVVISNIAAIDGPQTGSATI